MPEPLPKAYRRCGIAGGAMCLIMPSSGLKGTGGQTAGVTEHIVAREHSGGKIDMKDSSDFLRRIQVSNYRLMAKVLRATGRALIRFGEFLKRKGW
jgi:hypothetical protein